VRQGRFQPLSRLTEILSSGLASAADTEVTMLSERAATQAANHFEAVRLFMGGVLRYVGARPDDLRPFWTLIGLAGH
jgi:hypothetical protein